MKYSLFIDLVINTASCVSTGFSLTFSRIFFGIYWHLMVFLLGAMGSHTYEEHVKLTSEIRISVCYKIVLGFSQKFSKKWLHLQVGWILMNRYMVNSAACQMVDLSISKLPGFSVFLGGKILMLLYGGKWQTKWLIQLFLLILPQNHFSSKRRMHDSSLNGTKL